MKLALLLLLALTTLLGCAGSATLEIAPPMRFVEIGDQWVFSGENVSGGVTTAFTDTIRITEEELDGALYPSFRHNMVIEGLPPRVYADIVTQNPVTHDLILVGTLKPDGRKKPIAPNMIIPGSPHLGQKWEVHFDEDEGENYVACEIVARENVTIPLGTFRAWKMHAVIHSGPNSGESDLWLVPELGYYVKIVSGATTQYLSSTNVPLG